MRGAAWYRSSRNQRWIGSCLIFFLVALTLNLNFVPKSRRTTGLKNEEEGYLMMKKPLLQLHLVGRMGNCILQWATAMSIARRNNMELCSIVEIRSRELEDWFEASFPLCEDMSKGYDWDGMTTPSWELTRDAKDFHNVELLGYFNNVTEWDSIYDDVLTQFTLKQSHIDRANDFLQKEVGGNDNNEYITVGIHARYGDKGRSPNWVSANREYYVAAMEAAERMIPAKDTGKDIRFLLATEPHDAAWWDSLNLPLQSKVIHIGMNDVGDFTVLTLCDHLIVSEGTYSFLAAWFMENGNRRRKENDGNRIIFHDPRYFAPNIPNTPHPMPSWTQISNY